MKASENATRESRIDAALALPEASQVGSEYASKDIKHLCIVLSVNGKRRRSAHNSLHAALRALGLVPGKDASANVWPESWLLQERQRLKSLGQADVKLPDGTVVACRLVRSTEDSRSILKPIFDKV
ncbi:hypothetical protein NK8_83580 (plasmid) [Caballeronia sp. NK8]|uniref:hypothetical protein n=1 Tax=Caballeronia sp. NK8 TaxID=140098 RepID=UPI001BB48D70|nr:hypothetical protein [Caballeronia sp. NK8]BCQ28627.1 hypothetical protein NK8_68170 [Caballeronia sp. NK8]BCQ30167.1 hypothetical protein NK8_83580 [Caballeronia sp. NK8]